MRLDQRTVRLAIVPLILVFVGCTTSSTGTRPLLTLHCVSAGSSAAQAQLIVGPNETVIQRGWIDWGQNPSGAQPNLYASEPLDQFGYRLVGLFSTVDQTIDEVEVGWGFQHSSLLKLRWPDTNLTAGSQINFRLRLEYLASGASGSAIYTTETHSITPGSSCSGPPPEIILTCDPADGIPC